MKIQIAAILLISILLTPIAGAIAPEEKVPVIIGFKDKPDAALVREHGGEIKHQYIIINAIAANLPVKAIEKLRTHAKISYIEADSIAHALGETTPWGIAKINATQVWTQYNNKGTGIKVAILDTGIQYDHPDLKANIKGGVNFVGWTRDGNTNPKYWTDKNGHGTHVAGIVAAVNNTIGVVGVAPEASLYAVKVLNDAGSGYYSDIVQGIEWSINNNMQIISMSFGGTSDSQALKDACDKAKKRGIVLIAAAGNSGDGNPNTDNVLYPAKYDSVIAVAATDSSDSVPSWSSDGSEVDVAAPGVSILSTYKGSSYATMSGTSMAAPHVTGTVALMLSAGVKGDIQSKLQSTAWDIVVPGPDVFSGYGRIDAARAVSELN
ncbi:MAG: S8 family serine peptidase [Methanocellales archaeon]